jgi:hypothetical protein
MEGLKFDGSRMTRHPGSLMMILFSYGNILEGRTVGVVLFILHSTGQG